MGLRDFQTDDRSPTESGIFRNHFDVAGEAPDRQFLAWRERVGHVIDVVPTSADIGRPFRGSIDRYEAGGIVFTDCRTDALLLERSLARISTDSARNFAFHVFDEGGSDSVTVRSSAGRKAAPAAAPAAKFVALDLGQPVRMHRDACHVLTFFVPAAMVQQVFPDPAAVHARTMQPDSPIARLALARTVALGKEIATLAAPAAETAMREAAQLLIGAFGKQARLSGGARAAARAAMFGQVCRYVEAHLHRADLTPENVLAALHLPRPTLYRLFQHEGGLGAYIRHLRLRHAADDLVRYPHMMVTDVAYGVGFKSPSDFTRAFRRAYGMSPQEFRASSSGATH